MKKITLLLFMVLFNAVICSCTPETITDNEKTHIIKMENAGECCGGGDLPPPPSPNG